MHIGYLEQAIIVKKKGGGGELANAVKNMLLSL